MYIYRIEAFLSEGVVALLRRKGYEIDEGGLCRCRCQTVESFQINCKSFSIPKHKFPKLINAIRTLSLMPSLD